MTSVRRPLPKPKIKAPRKHGTEVDLDTIWAKLSHNIKEIQNRQAATLSFEENYRFAYNMVLHRRGDKLYTGVLDLVTQHLEHLASTQVVPAFPATGATDHMQQNHQGEQFLKALRAIWDDHLMSMEKLAQVLKYMDRVYTPEAQVPDIHKAGLILFQQRTLQDPIQSHLKSAVLTQIRIEREGLSINRSAVKECVDVCLKLAVDAGGDTVYKREIEPLVLKESEAFYKQEGSAMSSSSSAADYLIKVESRLSEEENRAHYYLNSQTADPLRQILLQNLLTKHLLQVIDKPQSGLDFMIDSDKFDDMARLYRLFVMVPEGRPCIRRYLKDSIARRGKLINQASLGVENDQEEHDQQEAPEAAKDSKPNVKQNPRAEKAATAMKWVQDVLDLKQKFDDVWERSMQSDRDIESGLNEGFGTFINLNDKAPEFISLFIDEHLRKGLKGKTDGEVEVVLTKTIVVFRYLTEKDVFERYYKGHLAKRLLQNKSLSNDAERGMLAKLKVESGVQFTQKLEGMFNDMRVSEDIMGQYRTHLSQNPALPIELSVTVMTANSWPVAYSGTSCNFSEELELRCKHFERFYLSKHSGRRLTWQPAYGNADIQVRFNARPLILNVSTYAMVILLLFENVGDDQFLTYEELKETTGIAEEELKRHLQSLACVAKLRILKKHPPSRDIRDTDSFSFNPDFTSKTTKVKIGTIAARVETGGERKETREYVVEERKLQAKACIVRVMKDRKHLTHTELVNEVTRQLASRYHPDPHELKKRIEELIEAEYLERCDDRKSYNYVA